MRGVDPEFFCHQLGGGIIFVPSAKNGEDFLYFEIFVQILIKSKNLLNIFRQILNDYSLKMHKNLIIRGVYPKTKL